MASALIEDIPTAVQERAKYLLLDGIGCLLTGSHLKWSALAVEALTGFDPDGASTIVGWDGRKTDPFTAAMLNSSFIQGFELDDYFPAAPLHSNAILIPAMLAVLQRDREITGRQFLLALILGYETGTRIGLALHGPEMLERGWHSGVVFGGAASAVAAGKLMGLDADAMEDAIGIASTQACGLMSAQFESMVKRMQHGFAARNGLYGAVLAKNGYVGIKRVLERDYGGFLGVFGEGHSPDASQVTAGLGSRWITGEIAVKPYAAMAGLHAGIDAALAIRGDGEIDPGQVRSIVIELGAGAFEHGGFPIERPIEPITAQMSVRYSVAVAMLDGVALLAQFRQERMDRDDVWDLIDKTRVEKRESPHESSASGYRTSVKVTFSDDTERSEVVDHPTGGEDQLLSNAEISSKFDQLTQQIADKDRLSQLRDFVLTIDSRASARDIMEFLAGSVADALA